MVLQEVVIILLAHSALACNHNEGDESCQMNNSCIVAGTTNQSTCPVWFSCSENYECKCIERCHDIIECDNNLQKATILACYCINYDDSMKDVAVGFCIPKCIFGQDYEKIPESVWTLNHDECFQWKRGGVLCGKCMKDYYEHAYSYNYTCFSSQECTGRYGDWWKYILAAYGPLTLFFIIIFVFRVNLTTSFLQPYVIFCQIVADDYLVAVVLSSTNDSSIRSFIKFTSLFYGIWNLDFFRGFYNICLKLDSLTIIALDYLIAMYPMLLCLITYGLIYLHDRNTKAITYLWRPFKKLIRKFYPQWDSHTSVVDAYAAIFILTYSKVLNVSFKLLCPATLYYANSNNTRFVLLYDGSDYFKGKHAVYGMLGIVFFVIFNVIPVILLVFYQFNWCKRILQCFPMRLFSLQTVMDIFQGCYKDGTNPGTKDLRWFSAFYFCLRVIIYVLRLVAQNSIGAVINAMLSVLLINLFVIMQPYKKKYSKHILLNVIGIAIIGLIFLSMQGALVATEQSTINYFNYQALILSILPLFFFFFHIFYCIVCIFLGKNT